MADFVYEKLPLIDEHNKQRQKLLGLERCWPTKCCWLKLTHCILGMAITDCHMMYCYADNAYNAVTVNRFADLMCANMPCQYVSDLHVSVPMGIRMTTSMTPWAAMLDSKIFQLETPSPKVQHEKGGSMAEDVLGVSNAPS